MNLDYFPKDWRIIMVVKISDFPEGKNLLPPALGFARGVGWRWRIEWR